MFESWRRVGYDERRAMDMVRRSGWLDTWQVGPAARSDSEELLEALGLPLSDRAEVGLSRVVVVSAADASPAAVSVEEARGELAAAAGFGRRLPALTIRVDEATYRAVRDRDVGALDAPSTRAVSEAPRPAAAAGSGAGVAPWVRRKWQLIGEGVADVEAERRALEETTEETRAWRERRPSAPAPSPPVTSQVSEEDVDNVVAGVFGRAVMVEEGGA